MMLKNFENYTIITEKQRLLAAKSFKEMNEMLSYIVTDNAKFIDYCGNVVYKTVSFDAEKI